MLRGLAIGVVSFILASVLEAMRIEAVRSISAVALIVAPLLLAVLVVGSGLALLTWTRERGRLAALATHIVLAVLGAGLEDIRFAAEDPQLSFPTLLTRGVTSFAVAAIIAVTVLTLLMPRATQAQRKS